MVTSVSWVSQRKLGDLTLSCTPGLAPRPCPLSDISPPPPHHPTPTARPPAPPRYRLLYSRRLPELLHAPAVLSPRCAAAMPFTLSLKHGPQTHTIVAGRHPRPALPSPTSGLPSCPPPLDRFLAPAPLPRPPALTLSVDAASPNAFDCRLAQPPKARSRPALDAAATSLGHSSTRLSPSASPQHRPPPLAASELLGHPTQADGYRHHWPSRLLWTPPAASSRRHRPATLGPCQV
jgi:hypothetical protein